MPLRFRRSPFTYLRRIGLAVLVLVGLIAAASFPPAIVVPHAVAIATALARAWFYFCSMMVGAAPFLAAGALAASVAVRMRVALPLFALLFPGCDCSMNAYAPSLPHARPGLSAVAIVWGSCCNPLALYTTAAVLGPRMLLYRVIAGAIATALTAAAWSKIPAPAHAGTCAQPHNFSRSLVDLAGRGVTSFAIAAGVSAVFLALRTHSMHGLGPSAAALLGAVLSPCSSADALLARALFAEPGTQLVFVIAAQCLDVRQLIVVYRSFGATRAAGACCAAIVACCIGRALVQR